MEGDQLSQHLWFRVGVVIIKYKGMPRSSTSLLQVISTVACSLVLYVCAKVCVVYNRLSDTA